MPDDRLHRTARTRHSLLARWLACALLAAALAPALSAATAPLWEAGFENGKADAVGAVGTIPAAPPGPGAWTFGPGITPQGQTLSLDNASWSLPARGHIDANQGALAFWLKPLDWGNEAERFVPIWCLGRETGNGWTLLLYYAKNPGSRFGTLQFLFLYWAMATGMPTGLASLVLQASAPFTVLLGATPDLSRALVLTHGTAGGSGFDEEDERLYVLDPAGEEDARIYPLRSPFDALSLSADGRWGIAWFAGGVAVNPNEIAVARLDEVPAEDNPVLLPIRSYGSRPMEIRYLSDLTIGARERQLALFFSERYVTFLDLENLDHRVTTVFLSARDEAGRIDEALAAWLVRKDVAQEDCA